MELTILKNDFSEDVVKKALYWLSEDAKWSYEHNKLEFIITITLLESNKDQYIKEKFYRLLNDFHLREKLDNLNKNLRKKIIEQALTKVYFHNA